MKPLGQSVRPGKASKILKTHVPVSGLEIDVLREAGDWRADTEALACRAAEHAYVVASSLGGQGDMENAELSIVLADNAFVQALNKTYRGKDNPTNVLSFPTRALPFAAGPEPMTTALLGDIVLAYESVAREAAEQDKSFEDHLSHLIVHGVLHLLGSDHEEEREAEDMENLERDILEDLGIADPYAADHLYTSQG